jgi:S-layer homology domain
MALALCLPIFAAAPVSAHGPVAFVVDWDERSDDTLVGTVTNHTSERAFNVTVSATWENGATDITNTQVVQMTNLAPHAESAFKLDPDENVSALGAPTSVTASGQVTGTKPTGALQVTPGEFDETATNVYSGVVTNDGAATANNVRVFAARVDEGVYTDAQQSAVIPTLTPGQSAAYTITFDPLSEGDAVDGLLARTTSGAFYTSWNNYFGDLGGTSESFVDDIVFLAEEGITTGCGNANFCPKESVTRAQLAVFLDRALGFDDASSQGFADIASLSAEFQQAINNVAAEGIASGCSVTPKNYCPNSTVTRGQMSKFIVLGYGLAPIPGTPPFTDDNGHFSESYNNRMAANGITSGCGTNLFCPNSRVTREQMAVFIHAAEAP